MANSSHQHNKTTVFEGYALSDCIAWLTLYGIEAVAIVILNVLIIVTYLKVSSLRKRNMYLIINLAVVDMFVGGTMVYHCLFVGSSNCNFWEIKTFTRFDEMDWGLWIAFALYQLFPAASITNLAAISLERMHATFRPWKHRIIKRKMFGAAIAAVWLTAGLCIAAIISLCLLKYNRFSVFEIYFSFFLFCLFIILVSYMSIAIKMGCGDLPLNHGAVIRERKLTKTLFIVTVLSLLLLLPRTTVWFLGKAVPIFESISDRTMWNFSCFTVWLLYANSLVNPILYAFRIPEFKRGLLVVQSQSESVRVRVLQPA